MKLYTIAPPPFIVGKKCTNGLSASDTQEQILIYLSKMKRVRLKSCTPWIMRIKRYVFIASRGEMGITTPFPKDPQWFCAVFSGKLKPLNMSKVWISFLTNADTIIALRRNLQT